jgi:DNA-binding response OmpR family regulator
VVEAADATEAVAVLASGEPVDVVFTDVKMPGAMDGLMLTRSGNCCAERAAGLIADEAFFSKPYSLNEVANRIRSLLEECRH